MLYYDQIDLSEGIGINKASDSIKCKIFHVRVCKIFPCVYNRCHNFLQKAISFKYVAFVF